MCAHDVTINNMMLQIYSVSPNHLVRLGISCRLLAKLANLMFSPPCVLNSLKGVRGHSSQHTVGCTLGVRPTQAAGQDVLMLVLSWRAPGSCPGAGARQDRTSIRTPCPATIKIKTAACHLQTVCEGGDKFNVLAAAQCNQPSPRGIGVSLPQECSAAEQVFCTWVARSRSGSSSFTASALNKPSSSSSSSSSSSQLISPRSNTLQREGGRERERERERERLY